MNNLREYDIEMVLSSLESEAFEKYCKKTGCTVAGAIVCLIREYLMNQPSQPEKPPRLQIVAERLERLEKTVDNWITTVLRATECNEKIGKQIACLQDEIESLERKIKDEALKAK